MDAIKRKLADRLLECQSTQANLPEDAVIREAADFIAVEERKRAIYRYQMGRASEPCPEQCGGDCAFQYRGWPEDYPCGHTATCEFARHKTVKAVMSHYYSAAVPRLDSLSESEK